MTIRAIIVDIGGVLLLRDAMPAHSAWQDRLGIDRGGFARSLFRSGLSARAVAEIAVYLVDCGGETD